MKKKNRFLRRLSALALAAVLLAGTCLPAVFADFAYPQAYWTLHSAWESATAAGDGDQIISVAQKTYDLLMPYGMNSSVCYNLEPKCAQASWACEIKGDLTGAITWLERDLTIADWLDKNEHSYRDILLDGRARMAYLKAAASPTVYALTGQAGPSYPNSGAAETGTLYGTATSDPRMTDSAVLMYVEFGDSHSVEYWIDYYKETVPAFQQAAENGGVIELAWNFNPQSTAGCQAVLSADSYIAESLAAMGKVNATILLRVGAEMNNWPSCDPNAFIQAFRKVAQAARSYSNIKLVFSPDNISNRSVDFTQFYPGDQYVDWIGVSTYQRAYYGASNAGQTPSYTLGYTGCGSDAYYGSGLYDSDPMVVLAPIAQFAQEHGKPMMISECGFSYYQRSTGTDRTEYAVDQLNKFYSYVNMVYPQIKAVFHFNTTLENEEYAYRLSDNAAVSAAYDAAIAANGGYLNWGQTSGKRWISLDKASQSAAGTLKLAAYAPFPDQGAVTVRYQLDGKQVSSSNKAPYYFELSPASLAAGKHTLKVDASSGKFAASSQTYTFYVLGGKVTNDLSQAGFDVASASNWAIPLLSEAAERKLITERTKSGLGGQITRLQFAELAVNLIEQASGETVTPADKTFPDTTDVMVLKAVAAGVAEGRADGTFAPNDKITRQEICIMLFKAIQYIDGIQGTNTLTNTSTQLDTGRFKDTAAVKSWAAEGVARITNNGFMSGDDKGNINPLSNTTIEQAITMILAVQKKL